jgi:hypothetical protein
MANFAGLLLVVINHGGCSEKRKLRAVKVLYIVVKLPPLRQYRAYRAAF